MRSERHCGFTLIEMLTVIGILAVIATFTIPKILDVQANSKSNAIAKEAAMMMNQAFMKLQYEQGASANTKPVDLMSYLNYTEQINSFAVLVDNHEGLADQDCGAPANCWRLHNGATIKTYDVTFGGTDSTNAIYFQIDPDGVYGGSTTGPSKAINMFQYYDGALTDYAHVKSGTYVDGSAVGACPSCNPTWFNGW
ncbi:MAG: type II secretion system GspH family protein [Vampirovibrio sp.]|nr:type II secretion system GspH family protein [Vampirovibrio sp.]